MHAPIFIVGYMGSGKSTVGRKMADLLGWRFIDTDFFIENRFRKRVADIFRDEGEAVFRRRERVVIEELSGMEDTIIATGGGLSCHSDNMELMNEAGLTLYLEVSDEVLAVRLELCKRTRPKVKDKTGEELLSHIHEEMAFRGDIYRRAKVIVNADKLVDEEDERRLVTRIVADLRAKGYLPQAIQP
ncbi:shikimate kinase [Porphyromonas gulae]|uniref:Shikimate kinase n=1 Tax=Porphyromonas gulae TaxID=111105 RepID=A0A0A2F4D5_9PORP|nr:shikimate kinase [Porphyromonas gulae]KGN84907.1 shikimate kinase [Porphyromonas gulae]